MILGLSQPITRPTRDMSNQFQLWTIPLDNPYDKQKDSCDELWVGPMNWFVSTYNGKPMALNFGEISLNEQKTVDPSLPRKLKSVTCWWNQRDKRLWICANQITYTSTSVSAREAVFRQWDNPQQQSACSLLNKKVKWVNDIKYKTLNTNTLTHTSHMHGSNNWNHLITAQWMWHSMESGASRAPQGPGHPRAYLFSCSWLSENTLVAATKWTSKPS